MPLLRRMSPELAHRAFRRDVPIRPELDVKRTYEEYGQIDAIDPKRTLASEPIPPLPRPGFCARLSTALRQERTERRSRDPVASSERLREERNEIWCLSRIGVCTASRIDGRCEISHLRSSAKSPPFCT